MNFNTIKVVFNILFLTAASLSAQAAPFVVDFSDSNFNLNNVLPLSSGLSLFDSPTSITGSMTVNGFGDVDGLSISVVDTNGTHTFTGENGNYRQVQLGSGTDAMVIDFGNRPFGTGSLTGSIGGFFLDSFHLDFRGDITPDIAQLPTTDFSSFGFSSVTLSFLDDQDVEGRLKNAGDMDTASITFPTNDVPEPGTLALFAAGLLGLNLRRRIN